MADTILKFQDQVPMAPETFLELVGAALDHYARSRKGARGVHAVANTRIDEDGVLWVILAGPAGPEVFRIFPEDVECLGSDDDD